MKKNQNPVFNMPGKNMRFDIPLHARVGTEFLALLMALMTFLCILAGCISISLNNMASAWSSGLADTVTIEIPHSSSNEKKLGDVVDRLVTLKDIKDARVVEEEELQELVEPWLGKGSSALTDLPVPSLITIKLSKRTPEVLQEINSAVSETFQNAKIDAHDNWLDDILKLSKGLQIAGTALIVIIAIVTALTVSGAVRSRMAIHHMELELLHIMGASDKYITRQFQKYILFLSGKGILLGLLLSALTLIAAHVLALNLPETLPRFDLISTHYYVLPFICLLLLVISTSAAHRTVMKVLKEMP
ncbi:MAG: hypothetical protein DI586_05730 [Micavibrio aeruginosavorus]|uniref:ABC3 transporter permease protein domain-containing protein n=1 Tax=Micavibrio aeruginosavorus TaxID=349221 RepID=A0A2W5FPN4_9BACT|nr:MAG: hypothetical protein DI586_05730 [Micavibrio aeruginosavorus]